ncbi:hypothetical protein [Veronia pacifica]|uniref:DUF2680 domain-containing protein n=1 Tax=Veronia pacifica TaxID=1080227 RepID=A0A1C3EQX3_9GAMM|nr:hypothetical protein [Veronia pacifica]ODA35641.1 hypothetical protein A8L45_03220 [Veronia pacifica]
MIKRIFFLLVTLLSFKAAAQGLIHPLDFKGTEENKSEVIAQIKARVKKTYTEIGMGDPLTLRLMEKEELNSFKKLTKAKNRQMLDQVINQYCSIGMCNYNTIQTMYAEQMKASNDELTW